MLIVSIVMVIVSELRKMTCCFTGHRIIESKDIPTVIHRLEKTIVSCIDKGYQYFGTGGALGFDTIAANTVLRFRNEYPFIRLILVLPCKQQSSGWDIDDIEEYNRIMAEADKIVYTSQDYFRGCMHKRNRHLIDNSSLCICYLLSDRGGTAYTVNYARKNGVQIINLAE